MGSQVKIYIYNSETDGWKQFSGAEKKIIKIDQKLRGIREYEIPLTHYVKNGTSLCGLTEIIDSIFYNDPRNQCDMCRAALREQTKRGKKLLDENDESENVINYKEIESKDNPQTAKVNH